MDLSLGNPFAAREITTGLVSERFTHRLGAIEKMAQHLSRKAAAWLANRRLWSPRTSIAAVDFQARLTGELDALRGDMFARTGVNIAVGAGSSHVVARTASRLAGMNCGVQAADGPAPDARAAGSAGASGQAARTVVVPRGQERAFLAPLRLAQMDGVSPAALRVFAASGLVTIGELQRVPKAALQAEFGQQEGLRLWRAARGLDSVTRAR